MGMNKRRLVGALFCTLMLALLLSSFLQSGAQLRAASPVESRLSSTGGGDVHGYIYTQIGEAQVGAQLGKIFLPNINVYVKNVASGLSSPQVRTDFSGYFVIPHPGSGAYRICWDAPGWVSGCQTSTITLGSDTAFPLPIPIVPDRQVVAGRVRLQDGRACRALDSRFSVDAYTTVTLLTSSGVVIGTPVYANVFGEYVMPKVAAGSWRLRADCEAARVEQSFSLTSIGRIINLTFKNSAPRIARIYASSGGQGIRLAAPGSTVQVNTAISDPDGNPLTYSWAADTPGFVSVNAPTVNWTLPNRGGRHTLYVQAHDGRGGYRSSKLTISTERGLLFSGTVRDTSGALAAGARVNVNGVSTTTNAQGGFSLLVPTESPRYVLTIEQIGYALFSKIYSEPITDAQFRLHKAFRQVINPDQPIRVVERGEGEGQLGSTVEIPAGALVDARGNRASGSLNLFLKTVDLNDPDSSFPGNDYAARNRQGREVGLISYGALDIQVSDASGQPYNLAPGQTARISIPVSPRQQGTPPSTIPLWWYNPQTGVWEEQGIGTLQGNLYVATVSHFSVFNMDVEFTNAACMRILVDQTRLSFPINLRVSVPNPLGGAPIVNTTVINDALSVITRLPPNVPVTLQVLDSLGNLITLGQQTVNSGPGIGSAPISLPYPYSPCNSEATLTLGLPTDPPFAPPAGEHHFLMRKGIDDPASTAAYYTAIDPTNSKTTFTDWKLANGMAVNPDANLDGNAFNDDATTGEVSAVYENAGDLGFGRAMHAKQVGANLAFYVCNYDTVDEARLNINLRACVAMDYSPVGASAPFTKFYVFDNGGARIDSADLDGRGLKYVPGLCLSCHGGDYSPGELVPGSGSIPPHLRFPVTAGNPDLGSFFLPFDLDALGYSTVAGFTRAAQESKFKALNLMVLNTSPPSAISSLIAGWYPSGSPTQISSYVPPGWSGTPAQSDLYSRVVKPACRTCHVAQGNVIDWQNYSDFDTYSGFIQVLACTQRNMPHAKVTFERFWLSQNPNQAATLAAAGLSGWDTSQVCPTP